MSRSIKRIVLIVLVFVLLVVGALFGLYQYALGQFEEAFEEYAKVAAKHDEAAYIPALAESPLRRDLNRALSESLAPETTADRRLARAKEGVTLLVLAEGNVDAIGDIGKEVSATVANMERASKSTILLPVESALKEIIELARRRLEIISDIRGLSYRANYHTSQIFERIVKDEGVLHSGHVEELNRQLPVLEEQFDSRSNLYQDLQAIVFDIEKKHEAIGGGFQI